MSQELPFCPNCLVRRADRHDHFEHRMQIPKRDFCDICREAASFVYTSIDDARHSVKAVTNVDVIYMAAKLEIGQCGRGRAVMMKMLRARLSKLIGLRDPQLYPGEPNRP